MDLRRKGDDGSTLRESVALLRVLANLVSNALAHSGTRSIVITLREHGPSEIEVHDDGTGIPQETLQAFKYSPTENAGNDTAQARRLAKRA